jgi:adenylate kinase family enzyme
VKLFILGPAGSGKSTLAEAIGSVTNVKSTNLDDLFWNNDLDSFGNKRNENERNLMLNAVLKNESWIMEGVYLEWPRRAMEEADRVIFLDFSYGTTCYRIIRRFIRRKMGLEKSVKRETWNGVRELLIWNKKQTAKMHKAIEVLADDQGKDIVHIKSAKDIEDVICRYRAN